jgi:hypothetical protein
MRKRVEFLSKYASENSTVMCRCRECYQNIHLVNQKILLLLTQKKSSRVDNWYLDDFFWRIRLRQIYLEQTIYHQCQPISCWLSSLAVEYQLISYVVWYASPADNIQLKQMILIWRGRYSSRVDDIHPMETIFIQERRIASMMVDSWNYNQPLELIFNHWGS